MSRIVSPFVTLHRAAGFGLIVAMASLPISAHATWACTNASGKTSFQDRPCETKAPSIKWVAVKSAELTIAGAEETLLRFDGAINERDMASAGRLLSKNFKSKVVDKRGRTEVGRDDFMDAITRTVQASKRYQLDRQCTDAKPDPLSQTLRLQCRKVERVDVLRRATNAETLERISMVLEGDEIRIAEISNLQP
jgi:hypothetical protein